jgi:hypothetical protein
MTGAVAYVHMVFPS